MNRRRGTSESGAALLEAVVALAAVAAVVVGGTELHRATVTARLDAERALAALVEASAAAERARLGPGSDDGAGGSETVATLWRRRACDDGTLDLREVPVRPDDATAVRGVLHVAATSVPYGVVLAVRTGAGDPAPGANLAVTDADGRVTTVTADAAGCVDLGPTPGPVGVAATTSGGATGRAAVPGRHGDASPTPGADATGPVPVTVTASGRVTLVLATAGALPDAVEGGRLTWWRGGATGGPVAAPGEALDLPEGPQGVVLGVCADARAGGSAAPVTVVPGVDAVVTVALGRVVVDRPAVADGRRLVLRRQRPCPGGTARPTLV